MNPTALNIVKVRLQEWGRVRLPHDFWLRWPPRIVSGVLLVLIAMSLWQSTRVWQRDTYIVPIARVPAAPNPKAREDYLPRLLDAHLFGMAKTAAPTPAASPQNTWSLIGLVTSTDPKLSIADIVINGQEHLIHVGDRLTDGSRVQAINATSVVLDADGNESLITYALRPAPTDSHFATLPIKNYGSNLIVQVPKIITTAPITPTKTLAALRRNALAIWEKRFRHGAKYQKQRSVNYRSQ